MAETTIIKQVTEVESKYKVLKKLLDSSGIILLKDKFGRKLPLKVVNVDQSNVFCVAAKKLKIDFSYSDTYTASFSTDSDKYMLETVPNLQSEQIVLSIKKLFHLQRRQTMRYRVPDDAGIKLVFNFINEKPYALDAYVKDLNSLGCSIVLPATVTDIKTNDLFDAELMIKDGTSVPLQGVIRNLRPQGLDQLILGIEFHHLVYAGEEQLVSMVAALHHTVHLKAS